MDVIKISTSLIQRKGVFRGWKVYLDGTKYPKKPVELYEGVSEQEAVKLALREAGIDPKEVDEVIWGDGSA